MAIAVREMPVYLDVENVAYIEGTTTKVIEIVEAKQAHQLTPEETQSELPHLTIAQVYGALAYYHAHKPDLDKQIEERRQFADALRAPTSASPTREQLRERLQHRT